MAPQTRDGQSGPGWSNKAAGIVILGGCLLYLCAVTGSGLDRMAQDIPSLAAKVPATFAVHARSVDAFNRLFLGDDKGALAISERLIAKAPLDPDSASALGTARVATGDLAGGDAAFRVAANAGWRNVQTQLYWLQQAAAVGDYPRAAERIDALARQSASWMQEVRILDPVESAPAGRDAIAERLASRPEWLMAYAGAVSNLSPERLERRGDVLARLASRGVPVGCSEIAPLVNRLVELNDSGAAAGIWRTQCPSAGTALVSDGNFTGPITDNPVTAFAWAFQSSGDVGVEIDPRTRGLNAAVVRNSSSVTKPLLSQAVVAPPGRYMLRWSAVDSSGTPTDRIIPSLSCSRETISLTPPQPGQRRGEWRAPVSVDGSCKLNWLGFSIAPNSEGLKLWGISLERAGAT
jgi:hypothetical protein